ncbi:MAG: hypothetical protein GY754_14160 [bacterium]|nr:hypothetical protein [bacterium]
MIFENLQRGKKIIRLNTGEELKGCKVGEDSESYTFRKKLYDPDEFTILKKKILLLTESTRKLHWATQRLEKQKKIHFQ